ncbi:MAG: hypothetical protein ACI90V_012862, partial [Bacillariaceae sp.]
VEAYIVKRSYIFSYVCPPFMSKIRSIYFAWEYV